MKHQSEPITYYSMFKCRSVLVNKACHETRKTKVGNLLQTKGFARKLTVESRILFRVILVDTDSINFNRRDSTGSLQVQAFQDENDNFHICSL